MLQRISWKIVSSQKYAKFRGCFQFIRLHQLTASGGVSLTAWPRLAWWPKVAPPGINGIIKCFAPSATDAGECRASWTRFWASFEWSFQCRQGREIAYFYKISTTRCKFLQKLLVLWATFCLCSFELVKEVIVMVRTHAVDPVAVLRRCISPAFKSFALSSWLFFRNNLKQFYFVHSAITYVQPIESYGPFKMSANQTFRLSMKW